MTSEEYWRMFHLVRGDIEAAIGCSTTYLTINRLAAADSEIARKYNQRADFWRATTYGLQTAFFIALGRVFDQSKNTYTIEDVVEQTIEHPGFFSRDALRTRMRGVWGVHGDQPDPELLAERVAVAWEPCRKDLGVLKVEFEPYLEKVRQVYEPIRNQYFAHRGKASEVAIGELFKKAVISEMANILRFAYGMISGIRDMANNATPPGQWGGKDYEQLHRVYEQSTEALVRSLR